MMQADLSSKFCGIALSGVSITSVKRLAESSSRSVVFDLSSAAGSGAQPSAIASVSVKIRIWVYRSASTCGLRRVAFKIVGAEAMGQGGFARDAAGAHQLGQGLLHGHHAVGAAYR